MNIPKATRISPYEARMIEARNRSAEVIWRNLTYWDFYEKRVTDEVLSFITPKPVSFRDRLEDAENQSWHDVSTHKLPAIETDEEYTPVFKGTQKAVLEKMESVEHWYTVLKELVKTYPVKTVFEIGENSTHYRVTCAGNVCHIPKTAHKPERTNRQRRK